MKFNFSKLLGLSLVTLVSCGAKGPSTISYADYRAKAIASTPEAWTSATVNCSEQEIGKDPVSVSAKFNYTNNAWVAEDQTYQDLSQYLYTAKEYGESLPEEEKVPTLPEGAEYTVNYYADLSMYGRIYYSASQSGITMSVEYITKVEFAQGGWLSYMYMKEVMTYSGVTPEMEEYGMHNGSEGGEMTVTVSYSK